MILFRDIIEQSGLKGVVTSTREVNHVCCDSRVAGEYSIFVCIEGVVTDGHLYAKNAYDRGCRCFVAQKPLSIDTECDVVYVDNSRDALAHLSDIVYNHPSGEIKVIGITGTKGKTTTALMISEILNKLGIPTGYIGSNGIQYGVFRHMSANTTPESCDIQGHLRDMIDYGMQYAVIEVSSQALYMGRVKYIQFDTCIFTNLYPDHIGEHEHPSFDHYRDCKKKLFEDYCSEFVLINADDPHSTYMTERCAAKIESYGIRNNADNHAEKIKMIKTDNTLGMSFLYVCCDGRFRATINFPGEFSVSNALAAIAVCKRISGAKIRCIMKALSEVQVEGRFQVIPALPYATIVIDYAHNGASLQAVLETLRKYEPCRIITLFGSVGGRTKMRRPELGRVASLYSDFCILTSDNPDVEDPQSIICDIALAFDKEGCDYCSIPDRQKAIEYAMSILKDGDILLLAGKGHENYQLIFGRRIPFCEKDIVLKTAESMKKVLE